MMRGLQFIAFFSTMLLFVGGVHYYFWRRLVLDTQLPAPWRLVATLTLLALGLSLPLFMWLTRVMPFPLARSLSWQPYLWMGAMLLLCTVLLSTDLLRGLTWSLGKLGEHLAGSAALANWWKQSHANLLLPRGIAIGSLLLTGGLMTVGYLKALGPPEVKRVEVVLDRWPQELDGFTIAQLSDLHIGLTLGRDWLQQVVDATQALRPDLVAITGDLVDGSPTRLEQEVAPLGQLRAPQGVFFVTGNHEYYSGVEGWLPALAGLGIRVLRNERVAIRPATTSGAEVAFDLAGIDDYSAQGMAPDHGPDLARALHGRDRSRELVLLAHQPRAIFQAAQAGVGLLLSGHTHGGQLWPWYHLVTLQQPYRAGLHRHEQQPGAETGGSSTQIYVSEGTGYWGPPIRLGTTSEITLLVLRAR